MKDSIMQCLEQAITQLKADQHIPMDVNYRLQLQHTNNPEHGDYASNIAMMLAKPSGLAPRALAELLINALPADPSIARVEIAGPGFINFFVQKTSMADVVRDIVQQQQQYGFDASRQKHTINVEFVSTNPTGPLHVGHGRNAAVGACIANLLAAIGYKVHREYYVNDAGRQIAILTASVWLRYLALCGQTIVFPVNGYKGDYIKDIAATLKHDVGESYVHPVSAVFADVPADWDETTGSGDKEAHIDAIIVNAKKLLGDVAYQKIYNITLDAILADIRDDLDGFRVHFDEWFSERKLFETGTQQRVLEKLRELNYCYEKDGALWFKSSELGDDKDRVVQRKNGEFTYFANDVAYHVYKQERGIEKMIDVLGSDHHGYVPRIKAALQALGYSKNLGDSLDVVLVQFAILYRGNEKVQMSTRSGSFVTLRELREEVGDDAARFFYVMRKSDQHLDFDLELAKEQSSNNPVYTIQYAHARVCSVFAQLESQGLKHDKDVGLAQLAQLGLDHEQALLRSLNTYQDMLTRAALAYEPHRLAQYLRDLAHQFHSYYNAERFIVEDNHIMQARLTLITAVKQILLNGLTLLGVSAPEKM